MRDLSMRRTAVGAFALFLLAFVASASAAAQFLKIYDFNAGSLKSIGLPAA